MASAYAPAGLNRSSSAIQIRAPSKSYVAGVHSPAAPLPIVRVMGSDDGRIDAPDGRPPSPRYPEGSEFWSRFEKDLFSLSSGTYNPERLAHRRRIQNLNKSLATGVTLEVPGRVSIVTPTMSSRQRYHEQLWANFEAQTWPDKELIVVETYEHSPSEYLRQKAKEDDRLVHVCFRRSISSDEDFNVGLKRNMTLHLASGEFVVNFDDDDIYCATYVQRMVSEIKNRGLVGITLSSWYNYFETSGEVGYTDPTIAWEVPPSELPQDEMDEVLYGYGFSYAHIRRAALALPYPDVEFAEDAPFFLRLRQVFGDHRVVLMKDKVGLCMHVVHNGNSAGDMPIARQLGFKETERLVVAPLFQMFLEANSSIRSVSASFDLAVQSFSDLWKTRSPTLKIEQTGNSNVTRHRRTSNHSRVKSC
jgi:glycosyltransferase involved in cell wall biosynthesis